MEKRGEGSSMALMDSRSDRVKVVKLRLHLEHLADCRTVRNVEIRISSPWHVYECDGCIDVQGEEEGDEISVTKTVTS